MHEIYLQQALALAELRRGFCAPNPAVGAVLVRDDQVVASGYHYGSGHPHAEAEALREIERAPEDAILYVTLEPCSPHRKKTPPCTELLIQKKIKKVVYGYRDPNPDVAGRGEQILRAAGIECVHSPLPEINAFYASYAHWWRTQTPVVTAKLALSLDGKIAGPQGARVAISGEQAQQFTHQQRKRSDAILTTAKTICRDDPLLNVRLENATYGKTIYVLDRNLVTPLNAKIFTTATRLIFLHAKTARPETIAAFTEKNAHCFAIAADAQGLHLPEAIQLIGQQGVHDLWVEAGGVCFAALARAHLLQHAYLYVSPKWLGQYAQSAFANDVDFLTNGRHWSNLGDDAVFKIEF